MGPWRHAAQCPRRPPAPRRHPMHRLWRAAGGGRAGRGSFAANANVICLGTSSKPHHQPSCATQSKGAGWHVVSDIRRDICCLQVRHAALCARTARRGSTSLRDRRLGDGLHEHVGRGAAVCGGQTGPAPRLQLHHPNDPIQTSLSILHCLTCLSRCIGAKFMWKVLSRWA